MAAPARQLAFAGGEFAARRRALLGPPVDLADLSPALVPPAMLTRVRATWQDRVSSEFRSIQVMGRFLTEVTGAGDPLDVYAIATALVQDEIGHAEMCAAVCAKLGSPPLLPTPVELNDSDAFLGSPMAERALSSAISMLAINETISAAIVSDLLQRCDYAPIRRVLSATIADEGEHGDFGWSYVRSSLARFDRSSL
jgi:hypothetical protein